MAWQELPGTNSVILETIMAIHVCEDAIDRDTWLGFMKDATKFAISLI